MPQATPLQGASYTWFGGNGNWNVATNWIPQGVPGPGDSVTILSGNVALPGGGTELQIANLYHRGGRIFGSNTLVIAYNFDWTAGVLGGGGGRLVAMGGMNLENTNTIELAGWTLENRAYGRWRGMGPLFMHSGAVLTNGGFFTLESAQPILSSNLNVRIVNAGYFSLDTTNGVVVMNPTPLGTPLMQFENLGSLQISAGGLRLERATMTMANDAQLLFLVNGTNEITDYGVIECAQMVTLNGNLGVQLDPTYLWPQNHEVTLLRGALQGEFLTSTFEPSDRQYYLSYDGWPWVQVKLLVQGLPPHIVQNAESWEGPPGKECMIVCFADGTHPMQFQWYKEGVPLPAANMDYLLFAQANNSHRGNYYCVVSNLYGAVTSQVATVSVVAPPRLLSFYLAGNTMYVTAENSADGGQLHLEKSTNPDIGYFSMTNQFGWPAQVLTLSDFVVSPEMGHFYRIATRGPLGTPIYATNIFGYWAYDLRPGYNLIAQPFITSDNSLNSAFVSVPNGSQVVLINSNRLETFSYDPLYGWLDESYIPTGRKLKPWEGFYFCNPSTATVTVQMVGELPVGNLTNAVPEGKCVLAPLFPRREFLGFPAVEGDRVWTFDEATQAFLLHTFTNNTWLPEYPLLFQHKAFWYEPAFPSSPSGEGSPPPRLWRDWLINSGYPEDYGYYSTPTVYTGPPHPLVPQWQLGEGPVITQQPASQTVQEGQPVQLVVVATGTGPLYFNWYFQGAMIMSGTNSVLNIPSANPAIAGSYFVVVSNAYGVVTSQVAMVQIGPPSSVISQVIVWGNSHYGPTNLPPGFTNLVAVAAGEEHCLGLRADGTVVAWGGNTSGQTNVPPGLSNVVEIAAGGFHSLALRQDGTVVAWGEYNDGQTAVPPSLSNVVAISAGQLHSLALTADGRVVAWGDNFEGQGNVPAGLYDIIAISAGWYYNMVLRADGTVAVWGNNCCGQTQVPPGLSNVVAISAGEAHCLALRADGTVVAWGDNENGATNVPAGLSNVVAISAGSTHSLALQADGTVVGWGKYRFSESATNIPPGLTNVVSIGAGFYYSLALVGNCPPRLAPPVLTHRVVEGSPAVFNAGATGWRPLSYQWRFNGSPIAGANQPWLTRHPVTPLVTGDYDVVVTNPYGVATSRVSHLQMVPPPLPPQVVVWGNEPRGLFWVPPGLRDVIAVVAGENYNLALRRDGTVVAWGDRWESSLPNYVPMLMPPGVTNVTAIAAGNHHALALRADGSVMVWGWQAGSYAPVAQSLSNVVSLAAGFYHNLALTTDGTVLAWGANAYSLTNIPPGLSNLLMIAAGAYHNLVLKSDGTVTAWGLNDYGQTNVPVWLSNVVAIAAGRAHNLALRADGTVVGWGNNGYGQTNVPAGLSNVLAIACGFDHSLALKADGTVVAWGRNSVGQTNVPSALGGITAVAGGGYHSVSMIGEGPPHFAPVIPLRRAQVGGRVVLQVSVSGQWPMTYQWLFNGLPIPGANRPWLVLNNVRPEDAGVYQVMVQNTLGMATSPALVLQLDTPPPPPPPQVVAWGGNDYRQLNVPGGLSNVVGIACGEHHSLALRRDGTVVAWGDNSYFQATVPIWLTNVIQVAAGYAHNLALLCDGTVFAWGDNSMAQLQVPPDLMNVVAIAASSAHSLALLEDGSVLAWGANDSGQCNVPFTATNVVAISAGEDFSLALRADGTVVGWGDNTYGQAAPPTGLSRVVAVAAGGNHSLALQADGRVVGWGANDAGQLDIPPGLTNVVAIAAGGEHSVALRADGTVMAWGQGAHGELLVPPGLTNAVAVAAGYTHTLALKGTGAPFLLPQVLVRSGRVGGRAVFKAQATGQWPLNYCWYQWFGFLVPIPFTNAWLELEDLQPLHSGYYVVEVGNAQGSVSSELLYLSVQANQNAAPVILQHPADRVVRAGSTVTLSVQAEASPPPVYQWFFESTLIPNATNATLLLADVRPAQEGYYFVRVSNSQGSQDSFSAYLTVIEQDPQIEVNGVYKPSGRHVLPDNSPVMISLITAYANGSIYYSTNNLHPDDGRLYTGPFEVRPPLTLKAIAYNSNRTEWTAVVTNRLEIGWEFPLILSTPGGGSVTASPGPGPYPSNTVVTLTASPAPGWTFLRWEGDATGTNPVTQVVMNRPRQAQAIFGTTIPLTLQGSGAVQFEPAARIFPFGSRVRLSALPNAGNYFQQWIVAGHAMPVSPLDLVLTNPGPPVVAVFAALPFNSFALNTMIVGGGRVTRSPNQNYYPNGTSVLLTAVPDPGFIFAGWSGDLLGTNAVAGLVMNANRTITAHFIEANRLAIIAQPRSQVVQVGEPVTLSVRAVGSNLFYQWFFNRQPLESGQSDYTFVASEERAGAYYVMVGNDQGDWLESEVAWVTVNRELNPQPLATLFVGTAADEAAMAVAVQSNVVYLGGVVSSGAGEAFGARVPANFTTNTSPLWQTIWPGRPGADGFMGILLAREGPVFAGYSEPLLSVARAAKGALVQLNATNGQVLFSRRTPASGAFDFDGAESLLAIARSQEPGGEFWYVTGQSQSGAESYGQMFVAKVTPGGSQLWVSSELRSNTATETLAASTLPGFALELPAEYSVGRAVVVMGGAVYVVGRCDIEGMSYAALWKFTLDGRLLWRRLGTPGEYYGLASMNGYLFAVGAANNFWSGQDFLVDKWEPEGWLAFSSVFDRAEQDDVLTAVVAGSGRLYACGYTYGGTAGGADAVVLRIDPAEGALLSTLLQGYYQDDFAHAIAMEGRYLYVAGETSSGGAGGTDAVLVRLFVPDLVPNAEPVVAFTSPADGTEFVAPATVSLEVSATDADDGIERVELYQDGMELATFSAPPYRLVVSNLWAGEYVFSAVAYDTRGARVYAAPVRIAVNNYAASYKLDFEGVSLTPGGVSLPFTLSNYLAGFGARVINLTPGSTVQVVRATQVYPGLIRASSGSNLLEHVSTARGAVTNRFEFNQVLDSVRFTRVAVLAGAAGAVHPQWRARAFNRYGMELSAVGENALFSPQDIPARTFTLTGPDISMVVFESVSQGLGRFNSLLLDDLVLNVALSSNSAPLVVITQPAQKAQFDGPANVTVRVLAEDYDGQVSLVGLMVNESSALWTNNLQAGRFEPSFVLSNLVVGTYRLVAVAYDNEGAARESAPVSFSVVAPAPPNDHFAQRLVLTGLTATNAGNSAGATFEPAEPYHAGVPGGRSVWFAWTAPQDGLATVTTAGSTFDTVVAVYTGTRLMELEEVASNDDDPSQTNALTSRVWFQARRGQTYQIAVDGYNGAGGYYTLLVSMNMPPTVTWVAPEAGAVVAAPGPLVLRAQAQDSDGVARIEFYRGNTLVGTATNQPPATSFTAQVTLTNVMPGDYFFRARAVDTAGVAAETQPVRVTVRPPAASNDMFASARVLSGPAVSVTDDNRSATLEPGEPDPWGGLAGNSLWYRWTAPASGTVLINTLGSSFDTLLEVYTGSTLQNLQLVALDDDGGAEVMAVVAGAGGGASLLNVEATAGTTYYIAVKGFLGAGGDVRLTLVFNAPPVVQLGINTNLARFTAPGIIPLVAAVSDDGVVKQVDFFLNEELIGSSVNPASTNRFTATLTLTNVPAGDQYVFAVRAVDDLGAVTWTTPLTVPILGFAEGPQILATLPTLEVVRGEKIELSVSARGTPPLQYQWFFNGFPLWGANSATLVIPNASPANSGLYFARVSNAQGAQDSGQTVVRVFVPPVITMPPASVVLPPGTSAVFTVTAVGTPPLSFQWYRYETPLPGATGPTLVITNVSPWEMGVYNVVVTNRAGRAQASASLTVSAVLAPPSSVPRDDFWVPDGPVHALAESSGTLFLGGNFRMVGPNTGLGVALDAASAAPDTVLPRVEGTAIYAVVPDGRGGWYIGGDFVRVGGQPRTNLAHILADRTVNPAWIVAANGPVRALLLDDQILYVGGEFSQVGGLARSNLAAIRTQDGALRPFAPNPDGPVRALAKVESKLYVGGDYLNIGGLPRARLAKVDPSDGQVRTDLVIGVDRAIHALLVDGQRLFVAGEFDTLTNNNVSFSRAKVALIDTEAREVLGWQAPLPAGPNVRVYALAQVGDTLYAGGDFVFTSGGVTYRHLAAFNRLDGAVRAWNPGAGGVVRSLAAGPDAIYAGGLFLTMGGQSRLRLAAVHPATGALLNWQAPANGAVRALALQENTLFAGGQFTLAGGVLRSNVAALRLATGQTTGWNPGANGPVRALWVSGTNVFLGGEFTEAGGQARSRIAAISALSGTATAWNPGASGTVRALAMAGKRLYVGGDFATLAGGARTYAGAVDADTGGLLDWNPAPDGPVHALRVTANGAQVYLGGEFNSLNGTVRPFLARVDASGALEGWAPAPNAPVLALALRENPLPVVYVGGAFSQMGGVARQRLAAVDAGGVVLPEFNVPVQSLTGDVAVVRALGLRQNTLDVGGWFQRLSATNRGHLGSVDAVTGVVAEWHPDLTVPPQALGVQALAAATNVVIAGGDFTRVGGDWRPYLAVFAPRGAPIIVGQPQGRVVAAGGSHTLAVTARGAWPLYFQWRLNGVNLPGATNATLTLTNIQLAQCGAYSVVASTPYGVAESQPANVLLAAPQVAMGDRFTNSFNLPAVATGVMMSKNTEATGLQDDQLPGGFKRGGRSVWATWVAPTNGVVTFSTLGSTFDSLLTVLQGDTLSTLVVVERDEDSAGNLNERVTFPVTQGNAYHLLVDGVEGASGIILLSWNLLVGVTDYPIITDQPRSRTVPENSPVNLQVTAQNAVSYQWFFRGQAIAGATAATYTIPSMMRALAGPYQVIAYGASPDRRAQSRVFVLEVGQLVQSNQTVVLEDVRTHDKFDDMLRGTGPGGQTLGGPQRQFFASVSAGSSGTQVLDNYGATTEPNEPQHGGVQGGASRWFRIDTLTNGVLVLDTIGSEIDTVLAVYQGQSLLTLQLVGSDDNGAPDGVRSLLRLSVQANQSYLVAVDGVNGAEGHIVLNYLLATPPAVVTPPVNQSVASGGSASFSVTASGTAPLRYQWYHLRTSQTNWLPVTGGTNATLSLTNVQAGDAGSLRVVVANPAASVTSAVATLTVEAPLRFATGGASSYSNGVFRLNISGKAGQMFIIQASTNLSTWIPISTNLATGGQVQFADPGAALGRRFYRAVGLE
ncbi:MAG: immunoglobulin domain-containing protein [Verrucomicrobiae bacterium]|nr:immunoglobulin domain-containing protein [Verrucomicrobiae bacterium]